MPAKSSTRGSVPRPKRSPPVNWNLPAPCTVADCDHLAPNRNALVDHLVSEVHRPVLQRRSKKAETAEDKKTPKEVCLFCGRRTKTLFDLRAHYNAEVGALPFECGVSFKVVSPLDSTKAMNIPCPYRCANNPNMHNHRSNWHGVTSIYNVPSKQASEEASRKLRRKASTTTPYTRPTSQRPIEQLEKRRSHRTYPSDAFWTKDAIFEKLQWFTNYPEEKELFEEQIDRALREQDPISIPADSRIIEATQPRSSPTLPMASSSKTRCQAASSSSATPSSKPSLISTWSSSSLLGSPSKSALDPSLDDVKYPLCGQLENLVSGTPTPAQAVGLPITDNGHWTWDCTKLYEWENSYGYGEALPPSVASPAAPSQRAHSLGNSASAPPIAGPEMSFEEAMQALHAPLPPLYGSDEWYEHQLFSTPPQQRDELLFPPEFFQHYLSDPEWDFHAQPVNRPHLNPIPITLPQY